MNKLTPKQKTFCEEYLVDLNGTQAAIRAGSSEKAAKEQGARLLTYANVKSALQGLMGKRSDRTQVKADDVVNELRLIGFSRLDNYLEWTASGVKLKSSEDLTDDQIACVVEIQESITEKSNNIKFKLGDKLKALELLGKHLGMFKENEKDPAPTFNLYQLLSGGNNGDLGDEAKLKERFGVLYPANGRGSDRL